MLKHPFMLCSYQKNTQLSYQHRIHQHVLPSHRRISSLKHLPALRHFAEVSRCASIYWNAVLHDLLS